MAVTLRQSTVAYYTENADGYSIFRNVKYKGAKGDGVTEDTDIIQKIPDKTTEDQIVYFDHGACLITETIEVPKNINITGEAWPLIMTGGDKTFQDQTSPKPVFRFGKPGDFGSAKSLS
ncbi:hypothetical protein Cpir12675_006411 [Ceratocystis pirilliformis]|uniref:Rhamnogalacturonase A/B/Epimerase-like pectate lyase domain-containing protein n=1 Tax=Ceratocystis pirilliformis TaxID=259994 RepID=A0ABR3YIJ9_9PEZI